MAISWFIATIAVSAISIFVDYVSNFSNAEVMYVVPGVLLVVAVNIIFWLPVVAYLHIKNNVSLRLSVASSLVAGCVGIASVIGVVVWLIVANGGEFLQLKYSGDQVTGYTSWTIGHIHYLAVFARVLVLWGINGILFWKLYGKFATNKVN